MSKVNKYKRILVLLVVIMIICLVILIFSKYDNTSAIREFYTVTLLICLLLSGFV